MPTLHYLYNSVSISKICRKSKKYHLGKDHVLKNNLAASGRTLRNKKVSQQRGTVYRLTINLQVNKASCNSTKPAAWDEMKNRSIQVLYSLFHDLPYCPRMVVYP